jgi:hypothetical protein
MIVGKSRNVLIEIGNVRIYFVINMNFLKNLIGVMMEISVEIKIAFMIIY